MTFTRTVSKVIDGDTFEVSESITHFRKTLNVIRLADVDAPELGTLAGDAARAKLREDIEGKRVVITPKAVDSYGRLVATYTKSRPYPY